MSVLFRFDYIITSNRGNYSIELQLFEFLIIRTTPKGCYIDVSDYKKYFKSSEKWVSNTDNHRFAYPTIEQAQKHLKIRTIRRIRHLENQLKVSELVKKEIEYLIKQKP